VLGSSWPRYVSAHGVVLNYRFETGKNAITARSEVDKSFEVIESGVSSDVGNVD
jgi:hypothetical protein